jgi:hypothetical protein
METSGSTGERSRWPIVIAALGFSALGLVAFVFYQAKSIPGEILEGGRSLAADLRSVAAAFRSGTITTTFVSYAAEMSGSEYLQFATLKQVEAFERTDRAAVLWGQLALPDVVVRAEAPVEYTYFLDLDERWDFLLRERTVLVNAPAIRFNTPAIDVSSIRYEVKTGSVLRDEELALENLKRGLTDLSKKRAADNVALVRELGRRKTEDFVRTWLLSHYDDAADYRVQVVFADEQAEEFAPKGPTPR